MPSKKQQAPSRPLSAARFHYIRTIAHDNYLAARILWNLGLMLPALHQLGEAVEKYLKLVWSRSQSFADEADFDAKLKKFGHDSQKVLAALPEADRKEILASLKGKGFRLYVLEDLRYGTGSGLVGFSESQFRAAELFILAMRKKLGEELPRNIVEDLSRRAGPRSRRFSGLLKAIVGSARIGTTKKERNGRKREFMAILARLAEPKKP